MSSQGTCPDATELESFLLGRDVGFSPAVLEAHLASCPECSARLGRLSAEDELVRAMRVRSQVAQSPDDAVTALLRQFEQEPHSVTTKHATSSPSPDGLSAGMRFGPYEILGVLGRGGMGIVYLAEDTRLHRRVALKVLQELRVADPRYVGRFLREGKALAGLHHPHIVQIHEVGAQDGRLFQVLEYVAGGSLAQFLAGRPQSAQVAAEFVGTLARAVYYAHERGIVHRDLKPANVLLRSDEWRPKGESTGPLAASPSLLSNLQSVIPKIGDFGLARRLEDDGLTQTGDLLGTPSYMAPEATRGKLHEVGPAVDVYALGAILYELLIGRPPFAGETALDTLAQVRDLEPLAPRRLRPGIPRDVETVCLKCLEKDPNRRYASAALLADELRRFLDGQPIVARPVAAWERGWKWSRRRPAVAGLIALSLVSLLVLLGGGLAYQTQLRRALQQAEVEQAKAGRQKDRADAQYREARATLQRMLEVLKERRAAGLPRLRELQQAQLQIALDFFLRAAAEVGDEPEIQADVARAHFEASRIQIELGRDDDAKVNLDRARQMLGDLVMRFPEARSYRADLAACLGDLGYWYGSHKRPEESGRCHEEALVLREALLREEPTATKLQADLAATLHGRGTWYYYAKRYGDAERDFQRAAGLWKELVRNEPRQRLWLNQLAETLVSLSLIYQLSQPGSNAEDCRRRAESILEQLVHDDPLDLNTLCSLAQLRINWAYVPIQANDLDQALAIVTKNVQPLEYAHRREPEHFKIREILRSTFGMRALIRDRQQLPAEAITEWERVVALADSTRVVWDRQQFVSLLLNGREYERAFAEAAAIRTLYPPNTDSGSYLLVAKACAGAIASLDRQNWSVGANKDRRDAYVAVVMSYLSDVKAKLGDEAWLKRAPELAKEPEFAPLRDRPEFQQLLGK